MTKSKKSKKDKKTKKDKIHISNKNNINIKITTGTKKAKRKYTKKGDTKKNVQFGNGSQYPHTQAIIPQPLPKAEPDYNKLASGYLAPIPEPARRGLLIEDAKPDAKGRTPLKISKISKKGRRPRPADVDSFDDLMKLSIKDLKDIFIKAGVNPSDLKEFKKTNQKNDAIRLFLSRNATAPPLSPPPQAHQTPAHIRHQRGILSTIGRFHQPKTPFDSDDDVSNDDDSDVFQHSPINRQPFQSHIATTADNIDDLQSDVPTSSNLGTNVKRGVGRPKKDKDKITKSPNPIGRPRKTAGGAGGGAYIAGYEPQPPPPTYPNPALRHRPNGPPPIPNTYLVPAPGIPGSPLLHTGGEERLRHPFLRSSKLSRTPTTKYPFTGFNPDDELDTD